MTGSGKIHSRPGGGIGKTTLAVIQPKAVGSIIVAHEDIEVSIPVHVCHGGATAPNPRILKDRSSGTGLFEPHASLVEIETIVAVAAHEEHVRPAIAIHIPHRRATAGKS